MQCRGAPTADGPEQTFWPTDSSHRPPDAPGPEPAWPRRVSVPPPRGTVQLWGPVGRWAGTLLSPSCFWLPLWSPRAWERGPPRGSCAGLHHGGSPELAGLGRGSPMRPLRRPAATRGPPSPRETAGTRGTSWSLPVCVLMSLSKTESWLVLTSLLVLLQRDEGHGGRHCCRCSEAPWAHQVRH